MRKFRIQDLKVLENSPHAPVTLCNGIGEMILSSIQARAKVEAVNPETGEYRVVLQGTLHREESPFDES